MFNKLKIAKDYLLSIKTLKCGCDRNHWCQDCLAKRIAGELYTGKSGDGSDMIRVN